MLEARDRVREEPRRAAEEIARLEELWDASPDECEAGAGIVARFAGLLSRRLGTLLALGWVAFLVTAFVQPTVNPEATTPLWADLVAAGFMFSLVGAGITGLLRSSRMGFAAATVAGAFGIALAIGCKATAHHLGAWWLYELGATAALTALAAVGLARSRR
jgi:hypothetical protein